MAAAGEPQAKPLRVLVTGAGGRTGRLVLDKLRTRPELFAARGLVRTEESKAELGGGPDLLVGSIAAESGRAVLAAAMQGCDAVVRARRRRRGCVGRPVVKFPPSCHAPYVVLHALCCASLRCAANVLGTRFSLALPQVIATSATPKMVGVPEPGAARPAFAYPEGGLPEAVDWHGQRATIDAAKAAGVRRVVVIGSRGGTDPNHMLNRIGGDGTNILVWKRKAEQYLIDSGLEYTIIRAGGLLDAPGGLRQLVVGADDADLGARTVPRADVAEMAVQALLRPEAACRSMDLVSKEDGPATTDFAPLFQLCKQGL